VDTDGNYLVVDSGLVAVVRVHPTTGERTIVSRAPGRGEGPPFEVPTGIAIEADDQLLVTGGYTGYAMVRVDPTTGNRTVVYGHDQITDTLVGRGPYGGIEGLAREADGRVVVVMILYYPCDDTVAWALARVNPRTHRGKIVSGRDPDTCAIVGGGPAFVRPSGDITVEADGHLVLVEQGLEPGRSAIMRVDRATGARSIVSGYDPDTDRIKGLGPRFGEDLAGIAVEQETGDLLVVDPTFPRVVRVHPLSGDRTVVSGRDRGADRIIGQGDLFAYPAAGLALDRSGDVVVLDIDETGQSGVVVHVDVATGDRTLLSSRSRGTGPLLNDPRGGLAVERTGEVLIGDQALRAIVRVDPATGNRTIVSR